MLRFRLFVVSLLMFVVALPAAAAERVESLPEIRPAMSARFDIALTLFDQPFIVGKGEVESPTRAHFVLKALPFDREPESTLEVVVYDGKTYTRLDDDTQWYVEDQAELPVSDPSAGAEEVPTDVEAAPLSRIGEVAVAGVPTDQYQIWISAMDDANPTDRVVLDFFIGKQINYLYQQQVSLFLTDEEIGQIKLETVTRLYDFDDATIDVGPPADALELTGDASKGLIAPLRNGGVLSTLSAPLSTGALRALVQERLAR